MDTWRRVRRPDSLISDLLRTRSRQPLKETPPAKNMNTKALRCLILAISLLTLPGCATTGFTTFLSVAQALANLPKHLFDHALGRREVYLQYQKHINELNVVREEKGLEPLPQLSYDDWKKGNTASPSGAQSPTSTGTATQR